MTDINEMVEIIESFGGAATFQEIVKEYQHIHPMVILPEHRMIIENTLKNNSYAVSFDSNSFLWRINEKNTNDLEQKSIGFTHVKDLAHASEYLYKSEYIYFQPNKKINVVVSPNVYKQLNKDFSFKKVHSTAFRHFPKVNNGSGLIQYGYKVVFDDEKQKEDFLNKCMLLIDSFDIVNTSHKIRTEKLLKTIIDEHKEIEIKTDLKINTSVFVGGLKVFDVYYRKASVRINIPNGNAAEETYLMLNEKGMAYQKETADPHSASSYYSFFVDDENEKCVYEYLLGVNNLMCNAKGGVYDKY